MTAEEHKKNILNYSLNELEVAVAELGEKKFRAAQIFGWLAKGVKDFDDMTNVPAALRADLADMFYIGLPAAVRKQASKDGTVKCLDRSLTGGEMLAQVLAMRNLTGEDIGHVVVMGMGEPFDNYVELSRFIRLIHDKKGYDLGLRNITVSTCGLIPKIKEFAADFPQVNLAVSLHAPNQKLRQQTMPVAKKYDYDELMKTCREYTELTGRRITFEYAVIDGVNDSAACAGELASRLKGWLSHVNLIPLNEVRGRNYKTANEKSVAAFKKILENNGVAVTVRRTLGSDIDAACGQLRRNR